MKKRTEKADQTLSKVDELYQELMTEQAKYRAVSSKRFHGDTVALALANGEKLIVASSFKWDGKMLEPGQPFSFDPVLMTRVRVLVEKGKVVTSSVWDARREYEKRKPMLDTFLSGYPALNALRKAAQKAQGAVNRLEAELSQMKGELLAQKAQVEKAERELLAAIE